jgi:arylsulfatase A-like enzyme
MKTNAPMIPRQMRQLPLLILGVLLTTLTVVSCKPAVQSQHPNIIYILADDLGYGDISSYNSEAAWETTHIDRLAEEGMMFTDAHTGSAVCTPTRYGVLTGRYAWRTRLKRGVLWSWDKPLIESHETTVGKLLQKHGYVTGCIGKWHLGLGWQFYDAGTDSADFSKPLTAGPNSVGFDYFYGITASLDIPPYVYIENDRSTVVPTAYTENNSKMGWWRRGLTGSDFEHEQVLPHLTEKAVSFIEEQSKNPDGLPFFLYFPLPAPHTPILPLEEFKGKSKTNLYGDFMLQVDHTVGEILNALDRQGITKETLIIFTSDNGCSNQADFDDLATFGHDPSHHFRGHKADIFEGGHRVPFVVRWPGRVEPGSSSAQIICLTDLLATTAAIVGDTLQSNAGVDSYNLLPALLDGQIEQIREATVHHSINGSFAIRKGKWKLINCPGSGGWSVPKPGSPEEAGLPPIQLYDMNSDVGETRNLVDEYPEVTRDLMQLLESYIEDGRSTPYPGSVVRSEGKTETFGKYVTESGKVFIVRIDKTLGASVHKVTVETREFEIVNDTYDLGEVDPVEHVFLGDLDGDGFEEIYITIRAAGSGSYGSIYGFASNRDKSVSEIYVPEPGDLPDKGLYFQGYRGHNEFQIENGVLVNEFPVYAESDTNANATLGRRKVFYTLDHGEASRILRPAKVENHE